MPLSDVLRRRRKELGFTLLEVAARVGVSEATVQRWESGNIKNLRYERIVRLAEVLEISPAALMGWTTEKPASDESGPSEVDAIFNELSPDNRAKLLELARLYLNDQRKNADKQ